MGIPVAEHSHADALIRQQCEMRGEPAPTPDVLQDRMAAISGGVHAESIPARTRVETAVVTNADDGLNGSPYGFCRQRTGQILRSLKPRIDKTCVIASAGDDSSGGARGATRRWRDGSRRPP